ncbi:LysR family transcriptional regulator [Pelomonas sp. V22]|uniref:LysR family transcriptional regulator n=1 Tax=Pelomonas sp. V22 TaxID=2822139 RepID=UPI0024A9F56A|nr:LysR family transcriptional regulator [Pelomonas sp. V22]MDI4634797.1 LysR family transcriptional regulator [Pelomonas sp. V22]
MDQLRALRVFVRVIDEGSFAGAARALDLAPAVVTRLVAELEDHLGSRLLNRTTRRLALTDIGESYLERARRILAELDEAEALVSSATAEPRGHLRVLLPPAVAVHQLAKHLSRFHERYPLVTLELHSPGPVDTVDEAYDITIVTSKHPLEGDFVARRLARSEVIMCASPEYLDKRGRPQHPHDLARHDALLPPMSDMQRGISLTRVSDGEVVNLAPHKPLLSASHVDTNYSGALHGLGIAGLPSFLAEDALMEQALERVLPEWQLYHFTIWAALPTRKYMPARTRAFLDFLLEIFGGEDRDPWLAAAGCETSMGGGSQRFSAD